MQSQCLYSSSSKQITTIRKQDYDSLIWYSKSVVSRQTQDAHARIYQLHRLRSLQKIPQLATASFKLLSSQGCQLFLYRVPDLHPYFVWFVGLLKGLHIKSIAFRFTPTYIPRINILKSKQVAIVGNTDFSYWWPHPMSALILWKMASICISLLVMPIFLIDLLLAPNFWKLSMETASTSSHF